MSESAFIVDVSARDFDAVVIEGSKEHLVVVDFWAEWCGPCRALAPILERVVTEQAGKAVLAKVDTEQERGLAESHQIRSLPTVRIYKDGHVAEEFMGAQPESSIRMLLERHLPRASDGQREQARRAVQDGQFERGIELLRGALAADPDNDRIHPELAILLLEQGQHDDAEDTLKQLPANKREDTHIRQLAAEIEFARLAATAPAEEQLRASITANPDDCKARLQLGAQQVMMQNYETAMDEFLEVLKRDRRFEDDAGRRLLLRVFEMLEPTDSRVARYRARMSTLLM